MPTHLTPTPYRRSRALRKTRLSKRPAPALRGRRSLGLQRHPRRLRRHHCRAVRELKGHPTRQRICFGLGGYPPLSILRESRGWDEACGQKARYEGAARPARDARKRTACLREVIHCGCFLPDSKANPIFPMRCPTREPRISIPFRLARTLARLGANAQGEDCVTKERTAQRKSRRPHKAFDITAVHPIKALCRHSALIR